jgi:acyl homoserine lactone synthase
MVRTISGTLNDFSPEFWRAIAQYRHKIFIERLGWQLSVNNGLERDQFDRPDTLYVIAQAPDGAICGCARLLPTTRPYLLGEIFPSLLPDTPLPCDRHVWELSRFAASAVGNAARATVDAAGITRDLLAASVHSASVHGARRLITVSPLGVERLLHRMGVHAYRAGPPVMIAGKPVFACWIEIDRQTRSALDLDIEQRCATAV